MKLKIRKGDTVEIISGRSEDKKKRGEVIRVIPKESRIVVQGVNIRSRHQGQTRAGRRQIDAELSNLRHRSTFQMPCWYVRTAINRPELG